MMASSKKIIIISCLIVLSLISLTSAVLSYYQLDRIPYGYHVDEFTGSVNIGCMATEGVDGHNVPHPLFAITGYGTPKPPTYLYPGLIWAHAFGYSVASLRCLSVTVHLLGIVGLLLLARLFFGWPYALLCMALASISPWTWSLGRVAFESLFAATFLVWGMYFFFKKPKIWNTFFSALFLAAAIYSYPPFRLYVPLMLLTLGFYAPYKSPRKASSWGIFIFSIFFLSIPLIQKTISGEIQKRFEGISIFSKEYLKAIHSPGHFTDIIGIFFNNYLLHFKWDFLFLKGDPSYVHSTGHFGILSWLDMAALGLGIMWAFMLVIKKNGKENPLRVQKYFVLFLMVNILLGVVPAALTNSELPNSLRITGAWPFTCLLSGYLLWQACARWWGLWLGVVILSVFFATTYFNVYFRIYPGEAKGMFAYWTLEEARGLKTDEDWLKFLMLYRYKDYTARYFLMQYHGMGCTQSEKVWEGMGDILKKRGMY